jgi:hypothetical protein
VNNTLHIPDQLNSFLLLNLVLGPLWSVRTTMGFDSEDFFRHMMLQVSHLPIHLYRHSIRYHGDLEVCIANLPSLVMYSIISLPASINPISGSAGYRPSMPIQPSTPTYLKLCCCVRCSLILQFAVECISSVDRWYMVSVPIVCRKQKFKRRIWEPHLSYQYR